MGAFGQWGRKDGFPGADGSTITQEDGNNANASTKTIYDSNGNPVLENGLGGYTAIEIRQIIGQSQNTVNYTIKNPLVFIYSSSVPNDWYTSNKIYQNDDLWNDGQVHKSIYDPCPADWRVPQDGTWTDFDDTNMSMVGSGTNIGNGRLYYNMGWFPLMGRRYSLSGILCLVGNCGYYWSSSAVIGNVTAKSFHVYQGLTIGPSYYSHRSFGYAVRCIQE